MQLNDFDYELPAELIAQQPAIQRDSSRLLVFDRLHATRRDRSFTDIVDYFDKGDVLVVNDTRVMPARLLGRKPSGGRVELLLVRQAGDDPACWLAMTRSSKPLRPGTRLSFGTRLHAELLDEARQQFRRVRLEWQGELQDVLAEVGTLPLPPYIQREVESSDRERYQTVFARHTGSVAAPTAGLHFTPQVLASLEAKGVLISSVTLHVGPGTFLPVRVENLDEHRMHCEQYEVSEELAETVNRARSEGRRVIAVGTTSTRALESACDATGMLQAGIGETELFITPGYRFRLVDALVTNFHLPRSTLLVLVAAFAGHEQVLEAYRHAVAERYRFFSYGDCMLIV